MEIEFKSKLVDEHQRLDLTNGLITFIGKNGCGKSSILEAIFQKYIEDDNHKVICFSSGQNELYSSLFNKHKKENRRYLKEHNEAINSFYFDGSWVRMLIFFSTIFKSKGLVRNYLVSKNYIQTQQITSDLRDDISSQLVFKFRVKKSYVNRIRTEISSEETSDDNIEGYEFEENQMRKTNFHETLEKIISNFNLDFDFLNNENLVKRKLKLNSQNAFEIFTTKNINHIFSFWALATNGWTSNSNLFDTELLFENNLEFNSLSDGEYQLLAIYAILDLFDSEETIFLFDEIDSHLYYENIELLWKKLKKAKGKIITTTHISDSILQNEIESIRFIENGNIASDLTIKELSKRLSTIVGKEKYEYKVASRIKNIVLIDDYVDWIIFKKLCKKKLGEETLIMLEKITPIKRTSSFETTNEIFGKSKLLFVEELKNQNLETIMITENIFLICDRDDLPVNQVQDDLKVNIHNEFKGVKKFNRNLTSTHLLSWKRREIENYLLSPTMLTHYGRINELRGQFPHLNIAVGNNLDGIADIRDHDSKTLLFPLYKDGGFDEPKLEEMITYIPVEEISEDIELMYNYLKINV